MASNRPPNRPVMSTEEDEEQGQRERNTNLDDEEDLVDAIQVVSTPKTPLQAQSAIDGINAFITHNNDFKKEHPKAQYDESTHILTEGKSLLLQVEVSPPSKSPIQHVGSKPVNTTDQREQTISCVMPAPEKLGTNFIQELLKTTGECEVECKTLEAAEKFIKLAGAQADKLSFDYTKAPFDAPGAEDRITKAVEKAMGVVAPQVSDEVTITPTNKSHL